MALGPERAAEIMRLAESPEGGVIELGGGVEATVKYGHVRFGAGAAPGLGETTLALPGSCTIGAWELRAELLEGRPAPAGPRGRGARRSEARHRASASAAGARATACARSGSTAAKTLQDLFSDAKVPRSLRRSLPVVLAGERIAWVAGVAVSEEFKLSEGDRSRRPDHGTRGT